MRICNPYHVRIEENLHYNFIRFRQFFNAFELGENVKEIIVLNEIRLDYSGNFLYENNELKVTIFTFAGRILPFDNKRIVTVKSN